MTQPIDLTQILESGGLYHGQKVLSILVELDCGKFRFNLQSRANVDTDSDLAKKILECVELSDVPLSRKQIAMKLKRKSIGGSFSQTVSALLETSQLVERDKLLTDDAIKFGDGTYSE